MPALTLNKSIITVPKHSFITVKLRTMLIQLQYVWTQGLTALNWLYSEQMAEDIGARQSHSHQPHFQYDVISWVVGIPWTLLWLADCASQARDLVVCG